MKLIMWRLRSQNYSVEYPARWRHFLLNQIGPDSLNIGRQTGTGYPVQPFITITLIYELPNFQTMHGIM